MFRSIHVKVLALILLITATATVLWVGIKRQGVDNQKLLSEQVAKDQSLDDLYKTGQQISDQQSANQNSSTTVTFLAVGDINLSRGVAQIIQIHHKVDYPFLGTEAILKSTNFNFANLESPFAPSANSDLIGGSSMTFGAPLAEAQGLKDGNFQVMNLANNHAFDQGLAGIDATRSILDKLDIVHEGTGDTLAQAWIPASLEINGIKICFVGATYGTNSGGTIAAKYITKIDDTKNLQLAIEKAKSECDFVVATMHAGTEYTRTPTQSQINFAHNAIDDGADIVIGGHPHWIQPIEQYKGKYIFYSLGNFIFDQSWSRETSEGLAIKIQISKNQPSNPTAPSAMNSSDLQGPRQPATLDLIKLIPVIITDSQPRPANLNRQKEILKSIGLAQSILK